MTAVTIITGASSGMGRALAQRFADAGDRVALLARRADRLEELATTLRARGGTALPLPCDVSDRSAVHEAFQRCEATLGPVDRVVANAGINRPFSARRFDAEALEQIFQVNVYGVAYCFEAALPGMIERRRGQVVGISSLAGYNGLPGHAAYSASKAALSNLMESLRMELQSYGIAVTTISPGFVRTEMTADYKHPMPLLMELDDAAHRIYDAIQRRAAEYAFPWPLAALAITGQVVPSSIKSRLMEAVVGSPS